MHTQTIEWHNRSMVYGETNDAVVVYAVNEYIERFYSRK